MKIFALLMVFVFFYLLTPNENLFNYDARVATTLFFIIIMYYGIKLALYIFYKSKLNSEIKEEKNKLIIMKNFNVFDMSFKCICWLIVIALIYFSVLRHLMISNLNSLHDLSNMYRGR